jgi:autotransporter-associated beta strand protein
LTPNLVQTYTNNTLTPLTTDAHTQSQICISNQQQIVDLQVGLLVNDTNTDDLSLHLISPEGTSVLLFENCGGTNASGLGLSLLTTNTMTGTNGTTNLATNYIYTVFTEDTNLATVPIKFAPPPFAAKTVTPEAVLFTNSWETVTNGVYTNGAVLEGWLVTNNIVPILATNTPAYVTNDEVGIVTDPVGDGFAGTNTNTLGSNYLALTSARIIQTFGVTNKFTVTNGQPYELIFYAKPMGVVDWWPGDNDPDDIIGTNNGIIPYNDVMYNIGEVNDAFVFSGISPNGNNTGNEVDFGTNIGNFETNNFTIDFWIKIPAGQAGQYAVMEKRHVCDATQSYFDIHLGPNERVANSVGGRFFMDMAANGIVNFSVVTANTEINDGLFHHAAFVRNGPTNSIYLDGVLDSVTNGAGVADINNTEQLRIGQSVCVGVDGSQPFQGELDELDIIDRALSPAEVYAIYHAGSLGKYTTNSVLPNFQLTIDDVATNTVILTNASGDWELITNSFTATNDEITVEFSGNPMGVLLDDIQLIQVPVTNYNNYYLPEEPLTPFIGENPLGCWTLDVWDTRNDSPLPSNGSLLSWTLQLTTSSTNVTLIVLTNEEPFLTNIQPGSITYFAVDVPDYATFATNLLTVRNGNPLTLLFDQDVLPTGGLPGDVFLTNGLTAPNTSTNILTTLGAPPPLLPGQRYFLGVLNNGPAVSRFTIQVNFDGVSSPIIPLTNSIPWTNIGGPTGLLEYFSFVVPTNAVMVTFQVLDVNAGEDDLYANDGLPLPGPLDFDYDSCNAGNSDQFIVVTTNSVPVPLPTAAGVDIVPLTPTTWYLGVGFSHTFSIVATYVTNGEMDIIPLTNAIPYTNTAPPGYPTNLLYSFTITNSPSGVQFTVTNITNAGNLQLLADLDNFPSPQASIAGSFNPGTSTQLIQIVPNAALPSLNGTWYLSVPNPSAVNVAYTITAITNFIVPPPIEPLTWMGNVDDVWDILATSNWVVTGSSPPTSYPYQNGSPVTFDDSATGTTSVYLSTTLSPTNMTVNNNAKTYTFFGPGSITGSLGINMTGSGTATFTETGGDSFTGGIINNGMMTYGASGVSVSGGVTASAGTLILDESGTIVGPTTINNGATLQVGNNDANGSLPTRRVTDNGSLVFDQTSSSTVGNAISGTGSLSQIGTGILSLAGLNTYTGTTAISAGTLVVDNTNALGSWAGAPVTISGGGTLDLGGLSSSNGPGSPLFGAKLFNISGDGVGGEGAIVNNGLNQQQGGLQYISLLTNASIGGITRWDMRDAGSTNTLSLNNFTLTKTGSNQISLVSSSVTAGNVVINQGVLSFEVTPNFAAPTNTFITANSGGYVGQNSNTLGSFICPIVLNGGGTTNLTGGGLTYLDAPIFLATNSSIGNGGGIELFDGIISGPFGFTNLGPGSNLLWATNTYTGPTYVGQGTLALTNTGSISNSALITVAAGATLDASQRIDGTLTLSSNQTLLLLGTNTGSNLVASAGSAVSGNGTVLSNLIINPGATLAVGPDPATVGTLTVAGTAILGGTNIMKINPALFPAQSNDVLTVSNVVYGGTLIVTNLAPTYSYFAGQSYTLYSVSNSSGAFTTEILPPLPAGLVWSTTFASNGPGTLIVTTNQQPLISQFTVNTTLSTATFMGTNGVPGGQYVVLTSTNVALPLASWTPLLTNYFDNLGNFSFTNSISTNAQQFYILQSP